MQCRCDLWQGQAPASYSCVACFKWDEEVVSHALPGSVVTNLAKNANLITEPEDGSAACLWLSRFNWKLYYISLSYDSYGAYTTR